jgi:hypothetical protein
MRQPPRTHVRLSHLGLHGRGPRAADFSIWKGIGNLGDIMLVGVESPHLEDGGGCVVV